MRTQGQETAPTVLPAAASDRARAACAVSTLTTARRAPWRYAMTCPPDTLELLISRPKSDT